MGYIVKLIPEEVYFVPNDHEIGMTESREKAIAEGLFFEYANARAKVRLFNNDLVENIDYIIESTGEDPVQLK